SRANAAESELTDASRRRRRPVIRVGIDTGGVSGRQVERCGPPRAWFGKPGCDERAARARATSRIARLRGGHRKRRDPGVAVAAACGVFLALAPLQALLSLLIFAVVVLASGYVSLASLTAAFSLPVLLAASSGVRSPLFSVAVLTFAFVVWTHRANIQRLRAGTEYRFGRAGNFGRRPSLAIGIGLLVLAAAFLAARLY